MTGDDIAQALIQVTGCLRNLSEYKRGLQSFWDAGTVMVLCDLLPRFGGVHELMHNIVRVLRCGAGGQEAHLHAVRWLVCQGG